MQWLRDPCQRRLGILDMRQTIYRDPVCGKRLNRNKAHIAIDYEGWAYFLCCPRCQREFEANPLDAVILTHAHIDHTGYLPRLVKGGYRGPVHASDATCDLLELLLPDSGYLQEEQASYANKKGHSPHQPAYPLYTQQQALESLQFLVPHPLDAPFQVDDGLTVTWKPAGHILGSAILACELDGLKLVFSGDLGRYGQEVMRSPSTVREADVLLVDGAKEIKIHGMSVPVQAQIASIDGLSAHGDYHELLRWLSGFERAPRQTFIVHGEPHAAQAFQQRIRTQLGWSAHVPRHQETVALSESLA